MDRPWLSQIHVHSGSQGVSLQHAAYGISQVVALAQEINDRSANRGEDVKQVRRIDIGEGSLSTSLAKKLLPRSQIIGKRLKNRCLNYLNSTS